MCGCILGWRSVTYHNLVTVTLNLTSDLVSRNWCISPIFFEIGIPNLVCKCILGCLSVTNHFWVTVTLTSDLVFKNYCVQSISPILFDVGIPNLGWWFLLGWRSGAYNFESFWPWHWLLASFLGFSCYIIAIFPQMCLVLDQFLWGHSSRVCDISCLTDNNPSWIRWREENGHGNNFMISLQESMGPGQDRTGNSWICSQTCICSQTPYFNSFVKFDDNKWEQNMT